MNFAPPAEFCESPAPFQFRLRTLFIVTTGIAAYFGAMRLAHLSPGGAATFTVGIAPIVALSVWIFWGATRSLSFSELRSWPGLLLSTMQAGGLFGACCLAAVGDGPAQAVVAAFLGAMFGWLFAALSLALVAPFVIAFDLATTSLRGPRTVIGLLLGGVTGGIAASEFSVGELWREPTPFATGAAICGALHCGLTGLLIDVRQKQNEQVANDGWISAR